MCERSIDCAQAALCCARVVANGVWLAVGRAPAHVTLFSTQAVLPNAAAYLVQVHSVEVDANDFVHHGLPGSTNTHTSLEKAGWQRISSCRLSRAGRTWLA